METFENIRKCLKTLFSLWRQLILTSFYFSRTLTLTFLSSVNLLVFCLPSALPFRLLLFLVSGDSRCAALRPQAGLRLGRRVDR